MTGWMIVAAGFAALGYISGDGGAYWVALLALLLGPLLKAAMRGER